MFDLLFGNRTSRRWVFLRPVQRDRQTCANGQAERSGSSRLFRFVIGVSNGLGATDFGDVDLPPKLPPNFVAVPGQRWTLVVDRRGAGRSPWTVLGRCKTLIRLLNRGIKLTQTGTCLTLSSEIRGSPLTSAEVRDWRRRESNPRPRMIRRQLYMRSRPI